MDKINISHKQQQQHYIVKPHLA